MLSFDITDRNIRIIKGTESGGKIKIQAAATLNLEEAVIVNGHVNDINRVAMMINQVLKQNNMPDKEAIISISSNQTVFKELMVPPTSKEQEFMKNVRHELQMQVNIDDSYAVSYVIVGEPEENENGEKMQKILATACPYDVVDCYKRIFHMLGITLKSMMIGCNCITKVLLADVKIKAKMPLLAVQIDNNFISLNLYENNQLSFSRFASIDPEDYDDPDDYVFEAVTENIFRMIQFARSRGSDEIENVIFYGDTAEIPRLIDELEKSEITVSQLNVPPQIHGYQNLEFSVYANAIGAMFKRNKQTEHINLLETEAGGGGAKVKNEKSANLVLGVGLIASLAVVGIAFGAFTILNNKVVSDTAKLRADIDSPETAAMLKQYDDLQAKKDIVLAYETKIQNASAAYKSQPVINDTYYTAIDSALDAVMTASNPEEATVGMLTYDNGVMTVPITIESVDEFSQKYASSLVQYLYDTNGDLFTEIDYRGYAVAEVSEMNEFGQEEEKRLVSFDIVLSLVPGEEPELREEEMGEETTEAAS